MDVAPSTIAGVLQVLTAYLIALIVGGTMIGISLFVGDHGDGDAELALDGGHAELSLGAGDADLSLDADVDVGVVGPGDMVVVGDAHVDAHGDIGDAVLLWLPFGSLRFWLFFLAFFGLTGTLLTTIAGMGTMLTAAISTGFGYATGVTTTTILRNLQKNDIDSSVRTIDCIGARGVVVLPVGNKRLGKIRLRLKGKVVEMTAATEEDTTFALGDSVMVYEFDSEGNAVVTQPQRLEA